MKTNQRYNKRVVKVHCLLDSVLPDIGMTHAGKAESMKKKRKTLNVLKKNNRKKHIESRVVNEFHYTKNEENFPNVFDGEH